MCGKWAEGVIHHRGEAAFSSNPADLIASGDTRYVEQEVDI